MDNSSQNIFLSGLNKITQISSSPNDSSNQQQTPIEVDQEKINKILFEDNTDSLEYSDKSQDYLVKLREALQNANIPQDKIKQIGDELGKTIVTMTMLEVYKAMNEEDRQNWEDFMATNPNDSQQLLVLNQFLLSRIGESLEDIQERIIERVVRDSVEEYNSKNQWMEKMNLLTDEQANVVLEMLETGDFDGARAYVDLSLSNKEQNGII